MGTYTHNTDTYVNIYENLYDIIYVLIMLIYYIYENFCTQILLL